LIFALDKFSPRPIMSNLCVCSESISDQSVPGVPQPGAWQSRAGKQSGPALKLKAKAGGEVPAAGNIRSRGRLRTGRKPLRRGFLPQRERPVLKQRLPFFPLFPSPIVKRPTNGYYGAACRRALPSGPALLGSRY
jgi:hypothetical protein